MPVENQFPIYHIPHKKNINFTGRDRELRRLRVHGFGDGKGVSIAQAITGLGGVGKTQLALEYSYLYKDEYDLIYWLNADSEVTLLEDLIALGEAVGVLTQRTTNPQADGQQVLAWLRETEKRWLLVFDNADMIEAKTLRPYLPDGGREQGHILITSRNPALREFAEVVELKNFTPDFAVSFLARRSGQDDETGFAALAKELNCFPLALEHAAAYMETTGSSATAYLDLYQQYRREVLAEAEEPEAYHATIMTTWQVAFAQVRTTTGAIELLNVCSFLAGEGIPLDLLRGGEKTLAETGLAEVATNPLALDKAIAALRRYSLLEREGEWLTMHRLVQMVVRERMGEERLQTWLQVAVNLVADTWHFDEYDMATWEASGEMLPHLISVCDLADAAQLETKRVAYLNGVVGLYLSMFGNYTAARPYYERALAIDERALGKEHLATATDYNNLGLLLHDMGAYEKARPYYERAIAIGEKTLGTEHPTMAIRYNNLGNLLQKMGDYEEALPYYERALAIDEKALGKEHPGTATGLNNLGSLLQDIGDYEAAWPYYERALAIDEKALGKEHPGTATGLNNLGSLLHDMGDYEGARPYHERALAIREKVLGAEHPDIAQSFSNLGSLLQKMGDYEEARLYYERALAIDEKALGKEHPHVAEGYNNLGALCYDEGDYAAAAAYFEQALAIKLERLGSDHPSTQTTRSWLDVVKDKL